MQNHFLNMFTTDKAWYMSKLLFVKLCAVIMRFQFYVMTYNLLNINHQFSFRDTEYRPVI